MLYFMRTFLVTLAFLVALPSQALELSVSNAQVKMFIPGTSKSAAYLTLSNQSNKAIELIKAEVAGVKRVEIHEHQHHEGMMRMRKLDKLTIPALEQVTFQPGGLHLMLFEQVDEFKLGEKIKVTLTFANGEQKNTEATVVKQFNSEQDAHHHHH